MCSESPFVCLIYLYLAPCFNLHLINFIMLNTMTFSSEHSGNCPTMVVVTWILGGRVIPEMVPGEEGPELNQHKKEQSQCGEVDEGHGWEGNKPGKQEQNRNN